MSRTRTTGSRSFTSSPMRSRWGTAGCASSRHSASRCLTPMREWFRMPEHDDLERILLENEIAYDRPVWLAMRAELTDEERQTLDETIKLIVDVWNEKRKGKRMSLTFLVSALDAQLQLGEDRRPEPFRRYMQKRIDE